MLPYTIYPYSWERSQDSLSTLWIHTAEEDQKILLLLSEPTQLRKIRRFSYYSLSPHRWGRLQDSLRILWIHTVEEDQKILWAISEHSLSEPTQCWRRSHDYLRTLSEPTQLRKITRFFENTPFSRETLWHHMASNWTTFFWSDTHNRTFFRQDWHLNFQL